MSKKELIIDGVDVSGCEFYDNGLCTLSNDRNERLPFCEKCTGYSDCLYKQFQQEKLKNENNRQMVASAENLINENAFLLGELEQLKKDNEFADTILQRKFDKLKNKLQIATEMLEKILLDVRFVDVEIHAQQALEQIGAENET